MAHLPTLEIVLVRHAEAVAVGTPPWDERDDERPLTEKGLRDADELAFELDPYHFHAAYSSPYARSLQTVTPTAARRSLEVQVLDDLRERRLSATPSDAGPISSLEPGPIRTLPPPALKAGARRSGAGCGRSTCCAPGTRWAAACWSGATAT